MPVNPVALMAALCALLMRGFGLRPQLSTLDLTAWQCAAVDPDTHEVDGSLPTIVAPSPEQALRGMFDALHELQLVPALDARAELHRTLAEAYPAGVTLSAVELADVTDLRDAMIATAQAHAPGLTTAARELGSPASWQALADALLNASVEHPDETASRSLCDAGTAASLVADGNLDGARYVLALVAPVMGVA